MTPPADPHSYDSSLIKPIRPPEVEGEEGHWHASWQLRLAGPVSPEDLRRVQDEVAEANGIELHLETISESRVRMEMITAVHPLDVEAWPLVDSTLLALDRLLGLAEINDCPRNWWRPFR